MRVKAVLSDEVRISPATPMTSPATVANGAVLDMAGWDGVLVIVSFGSITVGAVTSIKMQEDSSVGFGAPADLAGSLQTVLDTDDDKTFFIDLRRPPKQFIRVVVSR